MGGAAQLLIHPTLAQKRLEPGCQNRRFLKRNPNGRSAPGYRWISDGSDAAHPALANGMSDWGRGGARAILESDSGKRRVRLSQASAVGQADDRVGQLV